MRKPSDPQIPQRLLDEINDGNCVAFLGAGFSVPAGLPGWVQLLEAISSHPKIDADNAAHVRALAKKGSAHDLDQAAQVLEDAIGREAFAECLREELSAKKESDEMKERLKALRGIPFRAILTTNFDNVLEGKEPTADAFRSVLRPESHRWWDQRFWTQEHANGADVIKLHGDIAAKDSVVITRRDYRRLLYTNPGYVTFLRSVMSTSTVFYLGFSFGDAYLNELRSEVLSLMEDSVEETPSEQRPPPIAYALMNDVHPLSVEHFKRHEGMHVLSYDTQQGQDYAGFLRTLQKIHDLTNPVFRLAKILDDKKILWVDAHPENNRHGRRVMRSIAEAQERRHPTIVDAITVEEGLAALKRAHDEGAPFDLVISHWGWRESRDDAGQPCANAERLLLDMRKRGLFSPVLVFSRAIEVNDRKRRSMALGAQAYCFTYNYLLRKMEEVLGDTIVPLHLRESVDAKDTAGSEYRDDP